MSYKDIQRYSSQVRMVFLIAACIFGLCGRLDTAQYLVLLCIYLAIISIEYKE